MTLSAKGFARVAVANYGGTSLMGRMVVYSLFAILVTDGFSS
jgi:hypothetical protein